MPQIGAGRPTTGAFFDTDFLTIDTVLTVALLYGLQAKRECEVAIITMPRPNLAVAGFIDAVIRFYHGPAGNFSQVPPVGMATEGSPGETSPAFTAPFQQKKADGTPAYRNEVKSVIQTGDPVTLIRNYLQAQRDQSGLYVLAGPATNLAAALDFPGVRESMAAKLKHLVIAAGAFPSGPPEAHVKADIPAFRKVLAEWPTPIYFSGREVGDALQFPGASIDKEFAESAPNNPVADAYRAFKPMPYDSPSWAMAAALFAARSKEGYFKLSPAGKVTVDSEGKTIFTTAEKGNHQYLIVDPAQKEKIVQVYVELASVKPNAGRRGRGPQ